MYAASEGLQTVVVEREAPGGQAGQSAAIENYLGFPKGLSGADLTHRAVAQVTRFGAEMVLARDVVGLETRGPVRAVVFAATRSGEIEARAVLVATGVSYRQLEAAGVGRALTGRGVYYGANASEAQPVRGRRRVRRRRGQLGRPGRAQPRAVRQARRRSLVRSDSLETSMSQYLVERILARRQRRGAAAGRGRRPAAATVTWRRSRSRTGTPGRARGGAGQLAVRVHRRLAADRLARC